MKTVTDCSPYCQGTGQPHLLAGAMKSLHTLKAVCTCWKPMPQSVFTSISSILQDANNWDVSKVWHVRMALLVDIRYFEKQINLSIFVYSYYKKWRKPNLQVSGTCLWEIRNWFEAWEKDGEYKTCVREYVSDLFYWGVTFSSLGSNNAFGKMVSVHPAFLPLWVLLQPGASSQEACTFNFFFRILVFFKWSWVNMVRPHFCELVPSSLSTPACICLLHPESGPLTRWVPGGNGRKGRWCQGKTGDSLNLSYFRVLSTWVVWAPNFLFY